MSTYLELAQKMKLECGVSGLSATPATVAGQTGVLEKVVAWTRDGWRDIQLRHSNWRWMRSYFTVNTAAGTDNYAFAACTDTKTSAAIARFRRWWAHDGLDPFKCYLASAGQAAEYRLIWWPLEHWRRVYKFGPQASVQGQPIHVAIDDDEKILLGPNPNATYTVTGAYQRGLQVLAANGDIPDMPTDFHDLVVYYGMQRYAFNSVAPEVLSSAKLEASRMMRALELSQLPAIRLGNPLA